MIVIILCHTLGDVDLSHETEEWVTYQEQIEETLEESVTGIGIACVNCAVERAAREARFHAVEGTGN